MATDMFLELGDIKGESKDAKHAGKIDVLAWSWGLSNSGTFHTGTGGGAGKASINDISFTKWIDKASCAIMSACISGEHVKKAKLIVRKAGGKNPLEYFVMTLESVLVSSYSTGGSGGEDRLTENVTLNFAKFSIEYMAQKDDGTGEKAGNVSWDIAANKAK
jgi:type VI secretion system secreted protein Hcp